MKHKCTLRSETLSATFSSVMLDSTSWKDVSLPDSELASESCTSPMVCHKVCFNALTSTCIALTFLSSTCLEAEPARIAI